MDLTGLCILPKGLSTVFCEQGEILLNEDIPHCWSCAGILEQSMGARNRVGIGLLYRPTKARICKPFKEPRNRFLAWRASTTTLFFVPARQATWLAGSISRNRFLSFLQD
jgi:hypothetical protein